MEAARAQRKCLVCPAMFAVKTKYPAQRFCSRKCGFVFTGPIARAAANTPESIAKRADARRGTGKPGGYIKRDGRHEHRIIAEQNLGRPLLPGEVAHPRDEAKDNNAPSNVDVFSSQAEHVRHHNLGSKRPPKTLCKFGHDLTGENVVVTTIGRRRCLTCQRKYDRERKQSQRNTMEKAQ